MDAIPKRLPCDRFRCHVGISGLQVSGARGSTVVPVHSSPANLAGIFISDPSSLVCGCGNRVSDFQAWRLCQASSAGHQAATGSGESGGRFSSPLNRTAQTRTSCPPVSSDEPRRRKRKNIRIHRCAGCQVPQVTGWATEGDSRGSLRIVSGLAENTNSIFCDGSPEPEAANGCPVLLSADTNRREANVRSGRS
jgi:hypothetical protein